MTQREKFYAAALRLLARREHAKRELVLKLIQRGATEAVAEEIVTELAGQDIQSENRFAEVYVRSRTQRGYGPLKIQAELRQKGIDSNLIGESLAIYADRWECFAADWLAGKQRLVDSFKEQQKAAAALQRRGFESGMIRRLIRRLSDS